MDHELKIIESCKFQPKLLNEIATSHSYGLYLCANKK